MTNGIRACDREVEKLKVYASPTRNEMGELAAKSAVEHIRKAVAASGIARVAFAAAPSQDDILASLCQSDEVDWSKVVAFHLDEYVGLPHDAPQRFGAYLDEHIFGRVDFKEVHYLDPGDLDAAQMCARYTELLGNQPLDLMCIGIGENGHIAFNDPHVADFNDPEKVKLVDLDQACRQQQVNDGCFSSIDEVPKEAVTMTVPTIAGARAILCVVPGELKKEAVKATLFGPITTDCPASILRRHPNASLFLDGATGAVL